jgi:hypothetical protein
MAAFANARGGYIFFGITDNPRTVVGLDGKARASFDNLDQAKLTESLNEIFSPEIHWVIDLIAITDSKVIGVIYTFEADDKPIVARKPYQQQNAKIAEGDIFYRYNSRSQRIRFPELRRLLDEARDREQRAMMSHIDTLIRAGAANAAVLNFSDNILQGPTGQKVLMDEVLLDQISFIHEGEFDEVAGAPALKVVGEVQPATAITVGEERIVRTALSSDDVLYDFLLRRNVGNPEQYVRQTATGTTGFLPVQYYRVLARKSHEELLAYVNSIATRAPAKRKLVDRLEMSDDMKIAPPMSDSPHPSTVERRSYFDCLVTDKAADITFAKPSEAQHLLEAMKALDDDQIAERFEVILQLMVRAFDAYYSSEAKVADALRRAACRVDSAMFGSA